jgi:hypothetical protein
MLRNVLARQLPIDAGLLAGVLEAAGIEGDRRPQALTVDEWIGLLAALRSAGFRWPGEREGRRGAEQPGGGAADGP